MQPVTTELARSPAIPLAPFKFAALDGTAGPAIQTGRGEDVVSSHTYANCRIVVDPGVVLDASGDVVAQTMYMVGKRDFAALPFSTLPETAGRNIVLCYNAGWRNYYHWLIQAMFSMYLYAPHATDRDIFVLPSTLVNRGQMMDLAGIPPLQRLYVHKERNLLAESATIIDSSYSRHVFSPSPLLREFGMAIVQRTDAAPSGAKHIYISRRDSRNRAIANEAAVEALMTARGFHCVTLSELSFPEQVALFNGADVIVASHGAGLANTVFCRPGTRVVEFAPTSYMNPCFLKIGQTLGLDWELYGFSAPAAARQQEISWSVDLRLLAEVL